MITREELIESMVHEINVAKFIGSKLPAGRMNWRPTPKQRSVLELMQYLTRAGLGFTLTLVNGNRDHADAMIKKAETITPLSFARAMDEQAAQIRKTLGAVSNSRLVNDRVSLPWGGPPMSLGAAILNSSLKFLTAYRMQLFLYAKQLGREELGTAQAWAGRDPQPTAGQAR
jgi:hypothetical protein